MKHAEKILVGLFAVLIALTVAVYAHGVEKPTGRYDGWGHMGVYTVEEMDEMHDLITQNLDQETKEDLDEIHHNCIDWFKNQ